jgi:hypothetical protein
MAKIETTKLFVWLTDGFLKSFLNKLDDKQTTFYANFYANFPFKTSLAGS